MFFFFFFFLQVLKQYACVCVVVVVVVFVPLLQTHTHTHAQPTYAHSRTPTHTTCPLFSGERHGAMERHFSSGADAPVTRRRLGVVAAATRGLPAHRHSLPLLCEGSACCTPPRSHSVCWPGLRQVEGLGCSLWQCSSGQTPGQGLPPPHS